MTLLSPYLLKAFTPSKVITSGLFLSVTGIMAAILGIGFGLYDVIIGSLFFVSGISIIVPGLITSITETRIKHRGLVV
ncbi:hypothetical protein [Pantoea agglomerans]|uniref:hypothetical protein n=1 Tax=Enterobacter agglomerans TaxID=549 RepID=UPI000DFAA19F|nr:hypothetical protein [Pantoea agglomerans]SUB25473.1 Uncharacterised protein [Pantoea agglomerans]